MHLKNLPPWSYHKHWNERYKGDFTNLVRVLLKLFLLLFYLVWPLPSQTNKTIYYVAIVVSATPKGPSLTLFTFHLFFLFSLHSLPEKNKMERLALHSPSSATSAAAAATTSFSRLSYQHLRSRSFAIPTAALRQVSSLRSSNSGSRFNLTGPRFNLFHPKPFLFNPLSKPTSRNPPSPKPITASSSPESDKVVIVDVKPKTQGAKLIPLIISVSIGLIVRFLVLRPSEVCSPFSSQQSLVWSSAHCQ
uniref:Uncharacterized protein n=1 Tax=Solanum lycopersicum TaxID=4081 RepID=A0A3Q7J7D1_SOLLC